MRDEASWLHPEGIDRALIERVVKVFYERVRRDPLLGHVFDQRVRDWTAHRALLVRFWSSVLLMSGEYKGSPMRVHLDLPDLSGAHFVRWLDLFGDTLAVCCTPSQARLFRGRAERIAQSFQMARQMKSDGTPPGLRA